MLFGFPKVDGIIAVGAHGLVNGTCQYQDQEDKGDDVLGHRHDVWVVWYWMGDACCGTCGIGISGRRKENGWIFARAQACQSGAKVEGACRPRECDSQSHRRSKVSQNAGERCTRLALAVQELFYFLIYLSLKQDAQNTCRGKAGKGEQGLSHTCVHRTRLLDALFVETTPTPI